MTTGDSSSILETLITQFTADLTPLEAGFAKAASKAQAEGARIGEGLSAGLKGGLAGAASEIDRTTAQIDKGRQALGLIRAEQAAGIATSTQYGNALKAQQDALRGMVMQTQKGSDAYRALVGELAGVTQELDRVGAAGKQSGGFLSGITGGLLQGASGTGLSGVISLFQELKEGLTGITASGGETEDSMGGVGDAVGNTAETIRGFVDARKEEDEATRAANINQAKAALAFTLTAGAVGLLATGLVASFNAAADFEAAMNKAASTTEATAEELERLKAVALSPAIEKLGVDGIEAAGAIEELGGAGLSTAQILDGALQPTLNLARAVGTDVATAAEVAAASLKSFGLEAKDLPGVTDAITNAVNGTSVKMGDFAQALAQGGSVAQSSGLSFNEFTATISLMTDRAISASDAGTSLKTFLQALTPNSKQAKEAMAELGVKVFDAAGEFRPFAEIVGDLRSAFMKMTPEQRASTGEIIFGSDAVRALNILLEQGADGIRARTDLVARMGATDEAAATQLGGVRSAQDLFNKSMTNFKIEVGSSFMPAATQMLNWAQDFLSTIRQGREEYLKLASGGAAFGAEKYDLPTWLGRTGLRQNDLTGKETEVATRILATMQGQANVGAKNAAQWRTLGNDGMAQRVEERTVQLLGELGRQLIAIQAAAAQRPRPIGPQMGDTGEAAAQQVIGKALVSLLGMGGRTVLNDYGVSGAAYKHDGAVSADATHNGVDFAAKRGTPILAPFSGTLSVREDKKNGKIFELVDEMGNKLVGIHLDSFDKGILAALDAGGGKALIGQGQRIGGVGNTGTTAGSAPHLHLMGYLKGSTKDVNPLTIAYQGAAGGAGDSAYALPGADLIPTTAKSGETLLAEAKRILKAMETKDPDALVTAKASLKTFEDSGDRAKAALEIVRGELKKTKKEVSEFGQGYDALKKQMGTAESYKRLNDDAGAYAKTLGTISKNALAAASAEKAKYGETKKYDALFALAGDAAGKARAIRDADSKEAEQASKQQEAREKQARQAAAQVAEAARQGDVKLAQQRAGTLDQMRDNDLRKAGENAAAKLAVEKQYGEKTVQAAKAVADVEYQNAMKKAEQGLAQNRGQAETIALNEKNAAYAKAEADAAGRLDSAQKAVNEKRKASDKEAQAQAAKVNEAIRSNNIAGAREELTRLEAMRQKDLDSAKGSASERYKTETQYAGLIYEAKKAVLDKEKADRDADIKKNGLGKKVQAGQLKTSDATYQNGLNAAAASRDKLISDSEDALTAAAAKFAGETAKAYTDGLIEGLKDQRADEALSQKAAALNASVVKAVNDSTVKELTEQQRVILDIQAKGNDAVAAAAQKTAGELAKNGLWGEALDVLGGALGRVMDSALEGEDAGDSINVLTGAINDLTDARAKTIQSIRDQQAAEMALAKAVEANPARKPGSLQDAFGQGMDGTSEARRTRPTERLNADGTPWADPGIEARDSGAAERDKAWESTMRAERVDAYRESLKLLDVQQLDTAKSAAILAKDTERYGLIVAEAATRTKEAVEELGTLAEEKAVGLTQQGVNLVASLNAGAIGMKDFVTESLSLIASYEAQAEAAARIGDNDLAAYYANLADELRGVGGPALEAAEKLSRLQKQMAEIESTFGKFSAGADAAGGIAKTIGGMFGEAGSEFGSAMGEFYSSGMKGAEGIAKVMANPADIQAWAQAIQGVIGYWQAIGKMIDSFNPKLKALNKLMLENASANREAMGSRMVGGKNGFLNPYYDELGKDADALTAKANAPFWKRIGWAIFGNAPKTLDEEGRKALQQSSSMFNEFGSSLYGQLESSLMNAFESGDWTGTEAAFEKSLNSLMAKMALQMIIFQSDLKDRLKELVDTTTKAMADGVITAEEQADIDKATQALKVGVNGVRDTWQAVAPSLPGYGQGGAATAPEGSIKAQQERISKLQEQLASATTAADRTRIQGEIDVQQKILDGLNGQVGAAQGSLAALRKQVGELQTRYDNATTDAERAAFKSQIDTLNGQIAGLENAAQGGKLGELTRQINAAQAQLNKTTDEAERKRLQATIDDLNKQLQTAGSVQGQAGLAGLGINSIKIEAPSSIGLSINYDALASFATATLTAAPQILQGGLAVQAGGQSILEASAYMQGAMREMRGLLESTRNAPTGAW